MEEKRGARALVGKMSYLESVQQRGLSGIILQIRNEAS